MASDMRTNLSIALIGCVSTGKSTLLNSILISKLSDTKIRRTTMLPQVYLESSKSTNLEDILHKNRELNNQILNGNIKLTAENCNNIYHIIAKLYDIINLPERIYLNIYDIPGLNDSATEEIYYNYINKTFYKFDIIFIVVDIEESFNTSSSIKILDNIVENANKFKLKENNICIIANKCDDLKKVNGSLEFIDEEYSEMFEQIETEVSKRFEPLQNIKYKIIKMSAEDSFIYRMYKKDPNATLDSKLINKFGINEFGKRAWNKINDDEKVNYINEFIKNENINDRLELSGFNSLQTYIHDTFTVEKQCKILISNLIFYTNRNVGEYTALFEDEVTMQYNNIINKYLFIRSIYKMDGVEVYNAFVKFINSHLDLNIQSIHGLNQLSNCKEIEVVKDRIVNITDKLNTIFSQNELENHFCNLQLIQNKIVISLLNDSKSVHEIIDYMKQLYNNDYDNMVDIINRTNDALLTFEPNQNIDIEDPLILYIEQLKKYQYDDKLIVEFMMQIYINKVKYFGNLEGGTRVNYIHYILLDFQLNKIETFSNYLLDLKILNNISFNTGLQHATKCNRDVNFYSVIKTMTTAHQKMNIMSLFNYMIQSVLICNVDEPSEIVVGGENRSIWKEKKVVFTTKEDLRKAILSYASKSNIDKYDKINDWDVSRVTDMSGLFNGNDIFNEDISNWDVSNVTDMSLMFRGVFAFNQDISKWDVSNVTNMCSMFHSASAFNQDISKWNVSNVTNMGYMFSNATTFNQDISKWNVSKNTIIIHMFHNTENKNTNNINALELTKSNAS